MPYPAIVEASGSAILSNGQGSFYGPFSNGANLYCILQGEAGNFNSISAYKSTDVGLTWTEKDVANEITTFTGGGWISVVQSGTTLFVAYFDNATNLKLISFSMATDLWTTGIASNPVGFANASGAVSTYQELTFHPAILVRRSDNSFVIPYVGTEVVGGPTFARTRFDVWTGTIWSVSDTMCGENGIANNDLVVASILGAGDRTHVFYIEYATKTLKQRTITSANVAIAAVTVVGVGGIFDPGGVNNQSLGESVGFPAFNAATGQLAIPYKDTAGNARIAIGTSADSPAFVTEQINNTITLLKHGQTADGSQVIIAFYSGTPAVLGVVFLSNSFAPSTLYRSDKIGGIWTVPSVLMTTTGNLFATQQLSATGLPSGLAQVLLYNNPNGNLPVSYFQGLGAAGPSGGPVPNLVIALDQGSVITIPSVKSCCLLCDQPKITGLPRPIVRDKGLTYAR